MRKRLELPDDTLADIRAALRRGESTRAIACRYSIARSTVDRIAARLEVTNRKAMPAGAGGLPALASLGGVA